MSASDLSPEAPLAALVRDKIVCWKGLEDLVRVARKRRYKKPESETDYDTEANLQAEAAAFGALRGRDAKGAEVDCVERADDVREGAPGPGAGQGQGEV